MKLQELIMKKNDVAKETNRIINSELSMELDELEYGNNISKISKSIEETLPKLKNIIEKKKNLEAKIMIANATSKIKYNGKELSIAELIKKMEASKIYSERLNKVLSSARRKFDKLNREDVDSKLRYIEVSDPHKYEELKKEEELKIEKRKEEVRNIIKQLEKEMQELRMEERNMQRLLEKSNWSVDVECEEH
jgi:hypothetical protein